MRNALIEIATGLVVNVVEIVPGDGSTDPEGCTHTPSETANIGDSWDGANIIPAAQPEAARPVEQTGGMTAEPPDQAPTLQQQIDALSARLTALEDRASLSTSTISTTGDLK